MTQTKTSIIPPYRGKFRCILLFGAPGSGKGTLGKFLSSVGSHFHLSSGDIFRGLSVDSPVGKLHHKYASKGQLVPDDVTIEIWRHYVSGLIATNAYHPKEQLLLLDGIPRTLKQAKILDKYIKIEKIISLEVQNPNELIKRIQKRAKIERRSDDTSEAVLQTRMKVYETQTKKLLEYYPQELITTFNASQKPLEVLRDVLNELSSLLC